MDIGAELKAVLDNPSTVWATVLANLPNETRTALLVLATCQTPISIPAWQAAVARISTAGAVRFEAALRSLDDTFVSTARENGKHIVDYRNPSMQDFCAEFLDRNVGIATTVAANKPVLSQIERLIQLGTVRPVEKGSGGKRYPNIYEALISQPELLLNTLIAALPDAPDVTDEFTAIAKPITDLVAFGQPSSAVITLLRSRLTSPLVRMKFGQYDGFLFSVLDSPRHAVAVSSILGRRFEDFYNTLGQTATSLSHFDSLVNLDRALGRTADMAGWATSFESLVDGWLDDLSQSDDDSTSDKDYYSKVVEYLDLEERSRIDEWEEAEQEAAKNRRMEPDARPEEDEEWAFPPPSRSYARSSIGSDELGSGGAIRALFESLSDVSPPSVSGGNF